MKFVVPVVLSETGLISFSYIQRFTWRMIPKYKEFTWLKRLANKGLTLTN